MTTTLEVEVFEAGIRDLKGDSTTIPRLGYRESEGADTFLHGKREEFFPDLVTLAFVLTQRGYAHIKNQKTQRTDISYDNGSPKLVIQTNGLTDRDYSALTELIYRELSKKVSK